MTCLLLQQSQMSLHLHPLSDLLLTLSGISLCLFPALKEFFHLPLTFRITVPMSHLPIPSGQLSLTPIKSSIKLFPVINSVLQPLFPKPDYYFFSNRNTVLHQEQSTCYLKLYHPSSNRDWGMPHPPASYIYSSVIHFMHHQTACSHVAKFL